MKLIKTNIDNKVAEEESIDYRQKVMDLLNSKFNSFTGVEFKFELKEGDLNEGLLNFKPNCNPDWTMFFALLTIHMNSNNFTIWYGYNGENTISYMKGPNDKIRWKLWYNKLQGFNPSNSTEVSIKY